MRTTSTWFATLAMGGLFAVAAMGCAGRAVCRVHHHYGVVAGQGEVTSSNRNGDPVRSIVDDGRRGRGRHFWWRGAGGRLLGESSSFRSKGFSQPHAGPHDVAPMRHRHAVRYRYANGRLRSIAKRSFRDSRVFRETTTLRVEGDTITATHVTNGASDIADVSVYWIVDGRVVAVEERTPGLSHSRREHIHDARGRWVSWDNGESSGVLEYDDAGRLVRHLRAPGIVEDFAYDAQGRLVLVSVGDSVRHRYEYDADGRLAISTWSPGTPEQERETYRYEGRCTAATVAHLRPDPLRSIDAEDGPPLWPTSLAWPDAAW